MNNFEIVEALGGGYMVLAGGVQWAPPGYPRDKSGAASLVFDNRQQAANAIKADTICAEHLAASDSANGR